MPDEASAVAAPTAESSAPSDADKLSQATKAIEQAQLADKVAEPAAKPAAVVEKPKGRRVEKLEAKAVEAATGVAPENLSDKARYYLQHGDVGKAIETAFGDLKAIGEGMPDGVREALARKLGVGSAQWEKVRKYEQNTKRAFAEREQQLSGIVSQLQQDYAPLHAARQAYAAGDYDAAFKSAFGEDAADYQRKLISQRVGKNPEIEKLRAELEQERAQQRQWAEQQRQAQAQAAEQQAVNSYVADLGQQLAASEDAAIRKYSGRTAFVHRVFDIQRANYDASTNTTIPVHVAAEAARDEILNSLKAWQIEEAGGNPATAARAGVPPAKPPAGKPVARALKQTGAAESSSLPQKLTPLQIREKYQKLMSEAQD